MVIIRLKINSLLSPTVAVEKKTEIKNKEVKPVCERSYSIANSLTLEVKKSDIPAVAIKTEEPKTAVDKTLDITNKVTTGLNTVGTIATVPGEIVKGAVEVKKICNTVIVGSAINMVVSSPNSVKEKTFVAVGTVVGRALRITDGAALIAAKYNHTKTYNVMTKKILPTANGVISGIAIYTNSKKFAKAYQEKNNLAMVKSGTQIVLNGVSGVTGFFPGTGQTVSAVTGVASMVTDFAIDKTAKLFIKK